MTDLPSISEPLLNYEYARDRGKVSSNLFGIASEVTTAPRGSGAVWRRSGEFTSPRGGVKPPLHQTAPLPALRNLPSSRPFWGNMRQQDKRGLTTKAFHFLRGGVGG